MLNASNTNNVLVYIITRIGEPTNKHGVVDLKYSMHML
jgi:hypothetical protein